MADLRRVYIDSCGFIDMVKVDVGKSIDLDRQKDVWHLKKLLEAARDKHVEVYTSAFTLAECVHVGDVDITDEVKQSFNSLLLSGQYVKLVQISPFIGEDARSLRWKHSILLKPADAVHVATALERKCEEFLTTNGRLARLSQVGKGLEKLGLRVCAGRDTSCLPDSYRQIEMLDEKRQPKPPSTTTRVH